MDKNTPKNFTAERSGDSYEELCERLLKGESVAVFLRFSKKPGSADEEIYLGKSDTPFDRFLAAFIVLRKKVAAPEKYGAVFHFMSEDAQHPTKDQLNLFLEKMSWLKPEELAHINIATSPENNSYLKEKNPQLYARPAAKKKANILKRLVYRIGKKKKEFLLHMLDLTERRIGKFITFHTRPMYAKDITDLPDPLVKEYSCAIVMQGPILKKLDFTLETVRIYKKLFPFAKIVISTWHGEDAAYLEKIKNAGATIVLNEKPAYAGPFNINFQITSAYFGIKKAKELGAQYVLKSRTDQRMYNKQSIETLCNLIDYFPPSGESGQKKRLLFVHGGVKFQPYMLPDVFVFGDADDMIQYWELTLVKKDEHYTLFLPEIYLATRFLRKKGWRLDWTIEQWWQVQRECFIALNWADVELYWYKYDRYHEHMDRKNYVHRIPSFDQISFLDWFNIFSSGQNKKLLPEHQLFFREFPPIPAGDIEKI